MNWVGLVVGAFLGIGAVCAVARIIIGPTTLDRVLATDVLLAIVLCSLAADMAINHHTATMPILVALAFFGVTSSISITRFISRREEP
ncbi:monovalent cation/H+ antiporter complex subunit F [Lysinibacter cavernae]|uniref:Multicomponent Na+:H+ antiporter subunit F n=1 Tax=Lysinibacter cavernae TaxID=1640652 RepID=A0A7X5R1D6_9MICO|nr:monovalent cation/H+ antiporter complex subunit F [Lysinibacter cavernae]NIH53712.1 multicomponent Na+:H+ antiporter subunit F [Lysinibacter cavernae]